MFQSIRNWPWIWEKVIIFHSQIDFVTIIYTLQHFTNTEVYSKTLMDFDNLSALFNDFFVGKLCPAALEKGLNVATGIPHGKLCL